MIHTAQRRDLDDPKVIERFAELVQDEQHLKMLYLLTFADMRAVSIEIWNQWNAILLWQLYTRTLEFLQGEMEFLKVEELQARVTQLIGKAVGEAAIARHFEVMPDQGLVSQAPDLIGKQIQLVEKLGDLPIAVSHFAENRSYTQIGICTRNARGIFRQITAVFTVENINILRAMINTRNDGIVIDVLNVTDGQTGKGPILDRYHQIEKTLTAVWSGEVDVESILQEQHESDPLLRRQQRHIQPRIRIDNEGSDRATIIDIRAQESGGSALHNLGCLL